MADSVFQIALDGWCLAIRAFAAMPRLFGTAALSFAALSVPAVLVGEGVLPITEPLGILWVLALSYVCAIGKLFIFLSLGLAIKRFVVLRDDTADRPVWQVPKLWWHLVGCVWLIEALWTLSKSVPMVILDTFGPIRFSSAESIGQMLYVWTVLLAVIVISRLHGAKLSLFIPPWHVTDRNTLLRHALMAAGALLASSIPALLVLLIWLFGAMFLDWPLRPEVQWAVGLACRTILGLFLYSVAAATIVVMEWPRIIRDAVGGAGRA